MMVKMPEILRQRTRRLIEAARRIHRRTDDAEPVSPTPEAELNETLSGWRNGGWWVVAIFVGGAIVWSSATHLDAAAVANGVIGVESNRKTVAHLEGGIVGEIRVDEGMRVTAGQVLVKLEDTQARATLDLLRKRRLSALAEQARLRAERDGVDEIAFSDELLNRADEPEVADLLVAQEDLFRSRLDRVAGQKKVLAERILKQKKEIRGYAAQRRAHRQRVKLLKEEQQVLDRLAKKGLGGEDADPRTETTHRRTAGPFRRVCGPHRPGGERHRRTGGAIGPAGRTATQPGRRPDPEGTGATGRN